jgi:alanine-glyoxylate transaminase / serine-glyoxylate transaminase / serine-pyruvate transaminase
MFGKTGDALGLRPGVGSKGNFNAGGLGKLKGKVFRIGHLGDFNDLMLCAALCGVEMGLEKFDVPFQKGGVTAAMDYLNRGDSSPSDSQLAPNASEAITAA